MHSVLKQILLMRVALDLRAPRMVVADSFTPAQASVGQIWPHGLAFAGEGKGQRGVGRVHSSAG